MKRTYTALQALDLIFDPLEEDRDEAEPAEEEQEVSEEENTTDEEESTDEKPPETEEIFQSKDGNILWSSIPPSDRRRMLGTKRERSPQGPTRSGAELAVMLARWRHQSQWGQRMLLLMGRISVEEALALWSSQVELLPLRIQLLLPNAQQLHLTLLPLYWHPQTASRDLLSRPEAAQNRLHHPTNFQAPYRHPQRWEPEVAE
ncbi:hypothetical protein KOW79_007840 [Hemibagrus wyckioides]|uniref:Uncharacterized protein n=1 Tax=Hemibagrus wyckioides TaxID=337641 RepID=A0A9D3NQY1_9TELE|nr:hypothetical protein KOW79_007840 [Hemibagrus wyckioides]